MRIRETVKGRGVPNFAICLWLTFGAVTMTSACFTFSVTDLANRPHYNLAPILRISGASRTVDTVYILLEVQPSNEGPPTSYTLDIPLNLPELAMQDLAPPAEAEKLPLHHVTTSSLRPGGQLPMDTQPLQVQAVQVVSLTEVTDLARSQGPGLHVFSVTYSPPPSKREQPKSSTGRALPSGPILAVVQMTPNGEPEPVLVADVHEKTHHHGAWILMTPLAVAGDIVTFPLQLIGGLIIGC